MAQTQHTPGPWRVGYRALDIMASNPKGGEAKIFDVRGWGFLTGKGHGALGLPEDQAEEIQRANAQLAAASPDLLAIVRRFVEKLDEEEIGENFESVSEPVSAWQSMHDDARAVIAKAEGSTNA